MNFLEKYYDQFIEFQKQQNFEKEPKQLYEPIEYILSLGGKKIRPLLTLLSADVFGQNSNLALPAAMAIETFHNFTLIHDDIMDAAPLRRGMPTVHYKWNINTGILSGDAMMIKAYQYFENYEADIFKQLMVIFSKTALEVCEGQQWDVDFENMQNVNMPQYLKMIEFKTSVLIAAALKIGAIIGKANITNQNLIYNYGLNLGMAFQLLDDYLDAFGDPITFGKQVGGDIIENKKTFLYIKALDLGNSNQKDELLKLYHTPQEDLQLKINKAKLIFISTGSVDAIKKEIELYTQNAFNELEKIELEQEKKYILKSFGSYLMKREV
jgi:geranylgeranyl diphosphate synthase type II